MLQTKWFPWLNILCLYCIHRYFHNERVCCTWVLMRSKPSDSFSFKNLHSSWPGRRISWWVSASGLSSEHWPHTKAYNLWSMLSNRFAFSSCDSKWMKMYSLNSCSPACRWILFQSITFWHMIQQKSSSIDNNNSSYWVSAWYLTLCHAAINCECMGVQRVIKYLRWKCKAKQYSYTESWSYTVLKIVNWCLRQFCWRSWLLL